MSDYVRRCALQGCDAPIDDIPGRPARRYCTAAHRAAARQARRASTQPDQHVRLADTLPWLREPDTEPVLVRRTPGRVEPVPARRGLGARLGEHLPQRRRAIAVLGVAGILAGGYAVTSSQVTRPAGPTQPAPQGESSDGWAARAQVTLTSVDRQLDTIARTEAAWNTMPEHPGVGTPEPVAALMNRKALLERRKATLQSQLDSYRALARARADLELSEQNLDAVEGALRDAPAPGTVRSSDEASTLAALKEQRDLRVRQRDARKLELAALEGSVEKAVTAPLPDDGQQTTAVSDKVMTIVNDGGRGSEQPTSPDPGPRRPEVLAGGRDGPRGQERQATTTSAPPDPRGPRDESAERPAEPAKGPVGAVVGTVGGVLDGGPRDAPAADKPAEGRPAPEKAAEEPKGPVGQVADTVGGAADGLVGGYDGGQKASAPKASAPKASAPKASAPKASAPAPGAEPARVAQPQAPAPAPAAQPAAVPSGAMPGADLARAIVGSVPGGAVAAPAMEAAMQQAAAQPAGASTGTPSPSRVAPADATAAEGSGSTTASYRSTTTGSSSSRTVTTVTDDSGRTTTTSTSGSGADYADALAGAG